MKKYPMGTVASESRRRLLAGVAGVGALAAFGAGRALAAPSGSTAALGLAELPDGTLAEQLLYAIPGKVPLIKKSFRPPNFETPLQYFRTAITPNDAFFVRWHLAGISELKAKDYVLAVGGESADREVKFTLDQLKKEFKPAEITAVLQCSGNRRGLFQPHVAGVEWGVGAMGNAVWRGVRLRDVLAKAGLKGNALEVVIQRRGRAGAGQDAGFREIAAAGRGARREHADRLRDERQAAAALERSARPGSSFPDGPAPTGPSSW